MKLIFLRIFFLFRTLPVQDKNNIFSKYSHEGLIKNEPFSGKNHTG